MKTIDWIKTQELPTGGLAAWPGHKAYPEVTGYLIPTLLDYGEDVLAGRLGDWLESIQNPDGSYPGIDGIPAPFDTAAVVEGLRALGRESAEQKAVAWLRSMELPDGNLPAKPGATESLPYNWRAVAIMRGRVKQYPNWYNGIRTHYFAYALEGLLNMNWDIDDLIGRAPRQAPSHLISRLMNGGDSDDMCASTQIVCLKLRIGADPLDLIDVVRANMNPDGSFPHDSRDRRKVLWPCKYYLDMEMLAS
jgi:hypothetical protein